MRVVACRSSVSTTREPASVEGVGELLLAIALGQRVERLGDRLVGGLGAERSEALGRSPGGRQLGERALSLTLVLAQRRDGAGRGGGGVVELVRQPGGELADREQLLAVALDALDRMAHRLERRQELAQQRRVRERQAAQLLAVE